MKPDLLLNLINKEPVEDKPCQCSGPGNCPRFNNYLMDKRGYEICANKCPEDNPCSEADRRNFLKIAASVPAGLGGIVLGGSMTPPEKPKPSKKTEQPVESKKIEYPCVTEQAMNLAKAAKDWVAGGKEVRSEEEQKRIKLICTNSGEEGGKKCDYYDKKQDRCMRCGCGLGSRSSVAGWMKVLGIPDAIAMASKHCPLNKW